MRSIMSDEVAQRCFNEKQNKLVYCYVWQKGNNQWYGGLFSDENRRDIKGDKSYEGCVYKINIKFRQ